MSDARIKRFYTDVSVKEEAGRFLVQLDGRTAKTAGRHPVGAASHALAHAIADEWQAQEEYISLDDMPLTRLQGFSLDGGESGRAQWMQTVIGYLGSDLLCYRAQEPDLAKRQADIWQPFLDLMHSRMNAHFSVTEGIIAVDQPPEIFRAAEEQLSGLSVGEVYAIKLLTEMTGSAVLALILADDISRAESVFSASRLDETWQEEKWGIDEEAAANAAHLKRDFDHVVRFLTLQRER